MSDDLPQQSAYWDREVAEFDAIYSHRKGRFANWLDSVFRWEMYARFRYTLEHSEPIHGRTFLDVGCGTGRYALEFARREARQVTGLDISEQMLRVCEQRARAERLDGVTEFVHSDLLAFAPKAAFDVCTAIGLFDYVREPLPVVRKMRECTADRAIMTFPRFWTWRAPVRRVRLALRGCPVYFYRQDVLRRLILEAGFARHEVDRVGTIYCLTAFVA